MRADAARMEREQRAEGDDGEARTRRWRGRWQNFRDVMENQGSASSDARAFMVELNRGTLVTITEPLSEDLTNELQDAYNRAAFPSVYDDPAAADRYMIAALELTDLDDHQQTRLESIAEAYRPAHMALAGQIAEIYAESEDASGSGFDRNRWRGFQDRRNRLAILEFDRTEVNARALRQMRELLTERQQTLIRLPEEADQQEL